RRYAVPGALRITKTERMLRGDFRAWATSPYSVRDSQDSVSFATYFELTCLLPTRPPVRCQGRANLQSSASGSGRAELFFSRCFGAVIWAAEVVRLRTVRVRPGIWWALHGSNVRPHPCKGCALH